jgi:V8-like Glu-specific endopeptidase
VEKRVKNTNEWPHSAHGRLVWFRDGAPITSSGVLIGKRHVLTAAHNLKGANLKSLRFNRAQDGETLFDIYPVQHVALPEPWKESGDTDWDLAVLLLEGKTNAKHYEAIAPASQQLSGLDVALTGYPRDGGGHMWMHAGAIQKVGQEVLCYSMNTQVGESGGALYLPGSDGRRLVVGIHRFRNAAGCEGVRITSDKLTFIQDHL